MTNTEHGPTGETLLVARAAGADEDAFDVLERRHGPRAWRLAVAVTGDADDAASVVPEAFASVFTGIKAGRISPEADFGAEVLGAVRNAALDLARHREATEDAAPTPSTHEVLLGRAFGRLPERWRTTLWLTVVEDVAPGAVAPIVELSPHDTAQLAGRARRGLHEQFLNAHLAETGDRGCARAIPRLSAHAADELDSEEREKLERHLRLCAGCADRRRQLDDIAVGLAAIVPEAPTALAEPTRAAWSAAVAPTKVRTATGLSPTTEKILAGVSAVAAAAGVVGAAMLGGGTGRTTSTAQARPVQAAATETQEPQPLELDPGLDIPTIAPTGDLPRRSAPSGGRSVIGASAPTGSRTAAGDLGGSTTTSPTTTTPVEPEVTGPEPTPPAGEPPVTVGTTVGDVPVAVELGPEPGITVGPVTLGSAAEPGESILELGGPLAPVDEVVDDLTGDLSLGGLGLGG